MADKKKAAYLTIDDSPMSHTDELTSWLVEKHIPALLFARGKWMDPAEGHQEGFDKILRAIERGFTIANHSYSHDRASKIGFADQTAQIEKTQILIDRAYEVAGVQKPPRYFRFPHLDRGSGNAWPIDFGTVADQDRDYVQHLFWDGVRLETKDLPTDEQLKLKADLQKWLGDNGYEKLRTPDVAHRWWTDSELGEAVDALITFSTSDWMLGPRHVGKWDIKTFDDLTGKIDTDPFLNRTDSAHIVLAHDAGEDLLTITKNMVIHMLNSNFTFLKL